MHIIENNLRPFDDGWFQTAAKCGLEHILFVHNALRLVQPLLRKIDCFGAILARVRLTTRMNYYLLK